MRAERAASEQSTLRCSHLSAAQLTVRHAVSSEADYDDIKHIREDALQQQLTADMSDRGINCMNIDTLPPTEYDQLVANARQSQRIIS